MSKFAQGLSKLKLKEVPTYVQEHAGRSFKPQCSGANPF